MCPATTADISLGERNARLLEHKPLIRRIAGRMRSRVPPNVEMDDLLQAGLIGLNEAISRFEEGMGASFNTYASRRIEGAMLDTLRACDPLSREARTRQREIRTAVQRLEHRLGRAPRAKEVANELGWTLDLFYRSMLEAGASPTRTEDEALEQAEDEMTLNVPRNEKHTSISDHEDPLKSLQQRQRHEALNQAFDALEERERQLMEMIYDRELGFSEIGVTLGVSASRVSQMHEETVAKLRRRMRAW